MAKSNKVIDYTKNVIKSIKYETISQIKKSDTFVGDFATTNKDLFKDILVSVRDYRGSIDKIAKDFKRNDLYEAADAGLSAVIDSIKTGKLYSVEREEAYQKKYGGELFSDMADFDLDDFDVGDFDLSSDDLGELDDGDKLVATAVSSSTAASATMISDTVAKSSLAVIESNKASTAALYGQQAAMTARLGSLISDIGKDTIVELRKSNNVFETHAKNAKTFFEVNTQIAQENNAILKELLQIQKNLYQPKKSGYKSNEFDSTISNMAPDITAYFGIVKNNFKKVVDEYSMGLSNNMLGEGSNAIAYSLANPLGFLPVALLKSMIPNTIKVAAKSLDKTLSGVFGTIIARLNNYSNGSNSGIAGSIIGKLFGIEIDDKSKINTAKFNKEAIPFDGITKKATVDVIPAYLARIESALTGGPERVFNYNTGKWITKSAIKKEFDSEFQSDIAIAFYDLKEELVKAFNALKSSDSNQYVPTKREVNEINKIMFERNGIYQFNTTDDAQVPGELKGKISPEAYRAYAKAMQQVSRGTRMGLPSEVFSAKNRRANRLRQYEIEGSVYSTLFDKSENGSISNSPAIGIFAKDPDGRDVFFYLRNILNNLDYMREAGGGVSSRGRRGRGRHKAASFDPNRRYADQDYLKDLNSISRDEPGKVVIKDRSNDRRIVVDIDDLDQYKRNRRYEFVEFLGDSEDEPFINSMSANILETPPPVSVKDGLGQIGGTKTKGFIDKLMGAKTLKEKLELTRDQFFNVPTKAIEAIITTTDQKIYDFVYGADTHMVDTDGQPVYGFMNAMLFQVKNSFEKLNNWVRDSILDPLKQQLGIDNWGDLFKIIAKKLHLDTAWEKTKEFAKPFTTEVKDVYGGAFDYARDSVKSVFNPIYKRVTGLDFMTSREARFSKFRTARNKYEEGAYNRILDDLIRANPNVREEDIPYLEKEAERLAKEESKKYVDTSLYKSIKHRDKEAAKEKLDIDYDKLAAEEAARVKDNIDQNANGRFITKSGITAISKGEMIIPSEMNPFYDGKTDKKQEIRNEKNIKDSFAKSLSDMIGMNAEGTQLPITEEIGSTLKETGTDLLYRLGLIKEDDQEKLQEKVRDAMAGVKEIGPHAAATGLLGGTLGLLSGVIGGPLIGAAIGTAVGIAQRSNKFVDWLFGEEIKDSEGQSTRAGGHLLSQKSYEAAKKVLPSIGKWGVTGAITGLLTPFGPVGGLLIGSAIGWAAKNDEIHEMLFGDESGLLNKERRAFINKAVPKSIIGAGIGLLAGPFGLVGNLAVGAGLGLLSETDNFKDALFGEADGEGKRSGGIVGALKTTFIDPLKDFGSSLKTNLLDFIKNDLIEPLKSAIQPIGHEIGHIVSSVLHLLPNSINWIFEKSMGVPLNEWLMDKIIGPATTLTKKLFSALTKPVKAIIAAPFKIIGGIGNTLRNRQIQQGRATYMSAAERNQFRDDHRIRTTIGNLFGRDKYAETDLMLEDMNSDQIQKSLDSLNAIRNNGFDLKKEYTSNRQAIVKKVNTRFKDNMIGGSRQAILNAIGKGDYKKAVSLVGKLKSRDGKPLSEAERQAFMEDLKPLMNERELLKTKHGKMQDLLNSGEASENLKKLGITNFSARNLDKYTRLFEAEKQNRPSSNNAAQQSATDILEKSNETQTTRVVNELQSIQQLISGLYEAQVSQLDPTTQRTFRSKFTEVDRMSQRFKVEAESRKSDRSKALIQSGYNDSQLNAISDSLKEKDSIVYELAEYAASKKHPFSNFDGLLELEAKGVLDKQTVARIKNLLKYSRVPVGDIERISKMTEKEFNNVILMSKSGLDFFAGNGEGVDTFNDKTLGAISGIKDSTVRVLNRGAAHKVKGFLGNATRGVGKLFGLTRKTEMDYVIEFQKAGLLGPDAYTVEDIHSLTNRQREALLANPVDALANISQNKPSAKTKSTKGIFGKIRSGLSGVFHKYGKENTDAKLEEDKEEQHRNKFRDIVGNLANDVKRILGIQENIEKDKVPWYQKIWDVGKKLLFGSLAIGGGGLMISFLTKVAWPWFKETVWDKHLVPWWTKEDNPIRVNIFNPLVEKVTNIFNWLKEELPTHLGNIAGKLVNYFTGNTESGGFPKLLGTATGMIGKGFELVIGTWAPAVVNTLVRSLPTLGVGIVKGLGLFFKNTMDSFRKKVPKNVTSSDDGTAELKSLTNANDSGGSKSVFKDSAGSNESWSSLFMAGFNSTKNIGANPTIDNLADYSVSGINYALDQVTPDVDNKTPLFSIDGKETYAEAGAAGLGRAFLTGRTGLIGNIARSGPASGIMKLVPGYSAAKSVARTGAKGFQAVADLGAKASSRISSKIFKKAAKEGTEEVAEAAVKGVAGTLMGKIKTHLTRWCTNLFTSSAFLGAVEEGMKKSGKKVTGKALKELGSKLANTFAGKLIKKAGSLLAKASSKILGKVTASLSTAGAATVAFALLDFTTGMLEAESILGIAKGKVEITWVERLMAGVLKFANGFFALGVIPDDYIANLVLDSLAPALGIDVSDIQQRRQESLEEVAAYNEAHGTDFETVQEFNKKDSLGTKFGNWLHGTKTDKYGKVIFQDEERNIFKRIARDTGWGSDRDKELVDKAAKNSISMREYWADSTTGDKNNPVSGLVKTTSFMYKLVYLPYVKIGRMITDIVDAFKYIRDGFKGINTEADNLAIQDASNMKISLKEYWADQNADENDNNPLNGLGKAASFIHKTLMFPYVIGGIIGTTVGKVVDWTIGSVKTGWSTESDDKLIQDVLDGKYTVLDKRYWKDANKNENEENPLNIFGKISSFIYKLVNAPIVTIKSLFERISNVFSGVIDWVKNKAGKVISFFKLDKYFDFDTETEVVSSDPPKNYKKIPAGSGGGRFGTGHLSQRDPSIASMRFNAPGDTTYQTMADSGCGPVAAATVVNEYNKKLSPVDAARYAIAGGFKEKDGGTAPSYFGSVLPKYGIKTKYSNDANDIASNLRSGNPVIFMGTDGSGATPFGKTPHYVVGTKMDSKGRVSIEDPDSRTSSKSYSINKILAKSNTRIITNQNIPRGGFGSSLNPTISDSDYNSYKEKVYLMDLGSYTPLTEAEIVDFILCFGPETPSIIEFSKYAKFFLNASNKYHIDPRFMVALAGIESGWGTSSLAKTQNNFFGINAQGSISPTSYSSPERGIMEGTRLIREDFYDKGQRSIYECNFKFYDHIYCPVDSVSKVGSQAWVKAVADVMAKAKMSNSSDIKYIAKCAENKLSYKSIGIKDIASDDINNSAANLVQSVKDTARVASASLYPVTQVYSSIKEAHAASPINKWWNSTPVAKINSAVLDAHKQNISKLINGPSSSIDYLNEVSDDLNMSNVLTETDTTARTIYPQEDKSEDKKSTLSTIWDIFSNLGNKLIRRVYGDNLVDAVFGKKETKTNDNIDNSVVDENGKLIPNTGNYSSLDISGSNPDAFFSQVPGFIGKTNDYGIRDSRYYGDDYHTGTDYVFPKNTPVPSPVDGTVYEAGFKESWGNYVLIQDKAGYYHLFAHLTRGNVIAGAKVQKGQIIGLVGNTGNSFGDHLHYEVRKTPNYHSEINPNKYDLNSLQVIGTGYGKRKSTPMFTVVDNEELAAKKAIKAGAGVGGGGGISEIDYTQFILTIIEILGVIASNTDKLDEVIKIMSNQFGTGIITSGKGNNDESATEKVKNIQRNLLKTLPSISKINHDNRYNSIAENQDTQYIINALSELARE